MDNFLSLIVLILFISVLLIYPLLWINSMYWDNGKIPPYYVYSKQHEIEIIIALTGLIIRRDIRDLEEKRNYLNQHFNDFFREDNYDFRSSFKESYTNPLLLEEITSWINKHQKSPIEKMRILTLLLNIALVDGELVSNEISLLQKISSLLLIAPKDFDDVMKIHFQKQEEDRQRRKCSNSINSELQKEKCLHVLGLELNADESRIKKAYRTLVKECHPDRFAKESALNQQLAQERFIEIQKAYEYLSNS